MYRFNEPTFEPGPLFSQILLWLVQNKAEMQGSWDPNNDEYTISFFPADSLNGAISNGYITHERYGTITVWVSGHYDNQAVVVENLEQAIHLIDPLWEKYDPNEGVRC